MDGNDLGAKIADAVNSGINPDDLQEMVQSEHNYLQKCMFRQVFKPGIVALAGVGYTDARNEATVETCQEICDKMNWDY